MLYNQHPEPISTEVTVGTQCPSTPPYTPHDLQSSIKTFISTPLFPCQTVLKINIYRQDFSRLMQINTRKLFYLD